MQILSRGLATTLLLCSPPLLAAPFLGAALDRTSTEYSNIKDSTGYSLLGGYMTDSTRLPLFLEASYYDSGKLKVKDSGGLSFSYSGPQVFAGGGFRAPGGSLLWFKGGYYSFDGKTSLSNVGSVSGTSKGLSLGIGFDWQVASQLALRLSVEAPMKVDTTPGISQADADANGITKEKKQLSVIQFGLVWHPMGSGSKSTSRTNEYLSVPPAASTAAPAAPAPAAAVAATFKPGDEALARPGSVLRASPLESAAVVQNLSPSPLLKLENSIVNATGEWWFVSSDVERGWLRGDQLIKP